MASLCYDGIPTDMEYYRATLNIKTFRRMAYLQDKLHDKLETFKKSLPQKPKNLHNDLVSIADNMFHPATLFLVTKAKMDQSKGVENFLLNHMGIGENKVGGCSVDEFLEDMKCHTHPSVFLALLSGEGMVTECQDVIRVLKALGPTEKYLRTMLFVIDEKVTSRKQMYHYMDDLVTRIPEVSYPDECRGSRVFHRRDQMLLKLISQNLENHVSREMNRLHSLCKEPLWGKEDETSNTKEKFRDKLLDVFNSTENKLYDLANQVPGQPPTRCSEILGNILPQYGVLVIKQTWKICCSENNLKTRKGRSHPTGCTRIPCLRRNSFFYSEYILETFSCMFSGFVTGTIMSSTTDLRIFRLRKSPNEIACQIAQIVAKDGKNISTWMSNEIENALNEIREYIEMTSPHVQELYEYYREVAEAINNDDINIYAKTSLSRISGLKSFGFWKNEFEVSVCEDTWRENLPCLITIVEDAIRGDERTRRSGIENKRIYFRSREKDVQFHLFTGESGRECFGSVTLFAERVSDGCVVYFTCKHVVTQRNAFVKLFQNRCNHCQENDYPCGCVVSTGTCIHTYGVEDSHPFTTLSDGFVDISCISLNGSCVIDRSIQGPTPGRKRDVSFPDLNFRLLRGKEVFKKGRENRTAYGKYVAVQYLTPSEDDDNSGDNRLWHCGHDHSVKIPFCDVPRRMDLIEESGDSEVSFGEPGHSGGLVSFLTRNEDVDKVTPALVYVGKWPDHEKTYMCYRLREAMECLEQNNQLAHFSPISDDNCQDIHVNG
ncbi:uncharacterized protein [Argopecten irradians]|uniref:uncharacterized protein n=1 Tax=Argopecten irradians TaxID=31199 RepID=UPI0037234788